MQDSHTGKDDMGFIRKPKWWLDEVLSGRIDMKNAPASIQSWARFAIYQGAVEIIRMEWKEARAEALGRIPEKIRPYVEGEVRRLWTMRDDERL